MSRHLHVHLHDADVKWRVQVRMTNPQMPQHTSMNRDIRTAKVSAPTKEAAEEKALAYYKRIGYKNLQVVFTEQTKDSEPPTLSNEQAKVMALALKNAPTDPKTGKRTFHGDPSRFKLNEADVALIFQYMMGTKDIAMLYSGRLGEALVTIERLYGEHRIRVVSGKTGKKISQSFTPTYPEAEREAMRLLKEAQPS